MATVIPFKTGEDIKSSLSQINIDFDIANVQNSFIKASDLIKDIISPAMWQLMIDHYNSDNYQATPEPVEDGEEADPMTAVYALLDTLVKKVQDPLANFGMAEHFVWLMLRISNGSVTVAKSENETTAFKYLTDEAKEQLIETAYMFCNQLVDFINENATPWTTWAKGTGYLLNDIVRYGDTFYKCNEAHTSGETFDETKWTECEAHEVIFWQWLESEQYAELNNEIFTGYKDFNKYFDINRSAYFYYKLRHIINRVKDEEIEPRVFEAVTTDKLRTKLKRATAYCCMGIVCYEWDFNSLPANIRRVISNEMEAYGVLTKNADIDFVKNKISEAYKQKAIKMFAELEREVAMLAEEKEKAETGVTPEATEVYETQYDENKPYASML